VTQPPYEHYDGSPPHEDVDTSREAAERARVFVATAQERVYACYIAAGRDGCTDDEINAATDMALNTIRPRRRELEDDRRVVRTERRRRTRSGRRAIVFVRTEFAEPAPNGHTREVIPDGPLVTLRMFEEGNPW